MLTPITICFYIGLGVFFCLLFLCNNCKLAAIGEYTGNENGVAANRMPSVDMSDPESGSEMSTFEDLLDDFVATNWRTTGLGMSCVKIADNEGAVTSKNVDMSDPEHRPEMSLFEDLVNDTLEIAAIV